MSAGALLFNSDPDRIQTCDLQNRNLTFYSAELRGHYAGAKVKNITTNCSFFFPALNKDALLCLLFL